jgi:hypothetical protein
MSAYPNRNAGAGPARPATGDLDGVVGMVSPTGTRPGSDEAMHTEQPADAKLAALLDAADTVLAVHVSGVHGLCVACLECWGRLTPHPCLHAEWASAALARYGAPQPNSGAHDEV